MKPLAESTRELRAFLTPAYIRPERSPGGSAHYPKLTIITPSFNQGQFLERTILSVLNQGYPNLEYIIIDGGSTDNSVEVIRKYEKEITYWVSEKDSGQVDALNKGLRKATGQWIGFQNSDDVYFPGTFLRFGKEVSRNPGSDMVYGDLFMITADDEVTELLKTIPFSLKSQLLEGMQVHNQSLFFRRKLPEALGYFDASYRFAFDYEFITRYASSPGVKSVRVAGLAGALRVHEDAKSSTIADIGRQEHRRIRDAFLQGTACRDTAIGDPAGRKLNLRVPAKMRYLCPRIRKVWYLLMDADISYWVHRFELSRKG